MNEKVIEILIDFDRYWILIDINRLCKKLYYFDFFKDYVYYKEYIVFEFRDR